MFRSLIERVRRQIETFRIWCTTPAQDSAEASIDKKIRNRGGAPSPDSADKKCQHDGSSMRFQNPYND